MVTPSIFTESDAVKMWPDMFSSKFDIFFKVLWAPTRRKVVLVGFIFSELKLN